ncbi:Hypothetical predicted protein [Octopus vulgaris]|uniref:Uncharacterized protein n=1 Tax=Octopus vulgaris TaxID=6645 RepID=A0AA36AMQ3_OCTVU|nr:Hypothetical predicted protein [Octopus vulgaris]
MKSLGMVPEDLNTLASDRVGWRTKVWSGAKSFEEARIAQKDHFVLQVRRNIKPSIHMKSEQEINANYPVPKGTKSAEKRQCNT